MRETISIYKNGTVCLGKKLVNAGFAGKVNITASPVTITLFKPNATIEEIKKGLEITAQIIELELSQKETDKTK